MLDALVPSCFRALVLLCSTARVLLWLIHTRNLQRGLDSGCIPPSRGFHDHTLVCSMRNTGRSKCIELSLCFVGCGEPGDNHGVRKYSPSPLSSSSSSSSCSSSCSCLSTSSRPLARWKVGGFRWRWCCGYVYRTNTRTARLGRSAGRRLRSAVSWCVRSCKHACTRGGVGSTWCRVCYVVFCVSDLGSRISDPGWRAPALVGLGARWRRQVLDRESVHCRGCHFKC